MLKYEIADIFLDLFIYVRYFSFLMVFSLEYKNMNSPGY